MSDDLTKDDIAQIRSICADWQDRTDICGWMSGRVPRLIAEVERLRAALQKANAEIERLKEAGTRGMIQP